MERKVSEREQRRLNAIPVFLSQSTRHENGRKVWSEPRSQRPFSRQTGGKSGTNSSAIALKPAGVYRRSCEGFYFFSFRCQCVFFLSLSLSLSGGEVGIWAVNGVRLGGGDRALVVAADISHPVHSYRLLESSHSQPTARSIILQGPDAAAQGARGPSLQDCYPPPMQEAR